MAETFQPYNGNAASFVLPFVDNGGGEVTLTELRSKGAVPATFTRATPATTIVATGLVVPVASGVARSCYDPTTLEYLGYLAEGQRTNLLVQSEDFSVTWTNSSSSESVNAATAPDGTATADKLIEGVAGDGDTQHRIEQSGVTLADSTTYTLSVFAKAGERNWIAVRATAKDNTTYDAYFNLTNGALGTVSASATSAIKAYPNGWYRCELRFPSNTGATGPIMRLNIAEADNDFTYVGNGASGLFLWGAMVEAAALASSYIPTVAATVTRNADLLVYPFAPGLTGTLFASGRSANAAQTGDFAAFLAGNDNAENEQIYLSRNSGIGLAFVIDGGATQASPVLDAWANDASAKLAVAWATNDVAAVLGGGTVATDALATMPTMTQIVVGARGAGIAQAFGTIRRASYWPTRLSNNDLLYMTTHGVDFDVYEPKPSGGASRGGSLPAAFHAKGPTAEDKRRSRVKFGLEKEAEKVIERVAESQVKRQEQDAQKRFEQLHRELELSGIDWDTRYLEALNTQRERMIAEQAEATRKEQQAQADLQYLLQLGANAINEHYARIVQQLEQFSEQSVAINLQIIQVLEQFEREYFDQLETIVPSDLLKRRQPGESPREKPRKAAAAKPEDGGESKAVAQVQQMQEKFVTALQEIVKGVQGNKSITLTLPDGRTAKAEVKS